MGLRDYVLSGVFSTLGIATLLAVLTFLAKSWVETRLKESIKGEYDRALEKIKASNQETLEKVKTELAWEARVRERSGEVADFFSLWLSQSYVKAPDANAHLVELQKKYWQLALWLDAPVLKALHAALANAANPREAYKKALIEARRSLLNKSDDPIKWEDIYSFDPAPPVTPPASSASASPSPGG
jgi:hypothetical protein